MAPKVFPDGTHILGDASGLNITYTTPHLVESIALQSNEATVFTVRFLDVDGDQIGATLVFWLPTLIYLTTHLKTAQALPTQLLLTDLEPAQEGVSKVVIQRQDLGHFGSATVSRLEVHGCAESVTSTTPTPGGWSQWSQWSSCDASCGESGLRVRVRQLVLHCIRGHFYPADTHVHRTNAFAWRRRLRG